LPVCARNSDVRALFSHGNTDTGTEAMDSTFALTNTDGSANGESDAEEEAATDDDDDDEDDDDDDDDERRKRELTTAEAELKRVVNEREYCDTPVTVGL